MHQLVDAPEGGLQLKQKQQQQSAISMDESDLQARLNNLRQPWISFFFEMKVLEGLKESWIISWHVLSMYVSCVSIYQSI